MSWLRSRSVYDADTEEAELNVNKRRAVYLAKKTQQIQNKAKVKRGEN